MIDDGMRTRKEAIIDLLGGCILAVQRVEDGTADEPTRGVYEDIELQGWMADVKEMM